MFITFEGIDGSGKSTQAKKFAEWLLDHKGITPMLTREPGGWEGGDVLRGMVLNGELRHKWSEAFLFMLDRCEHVARVIAPALAEGQTVLCERYQDSTLAYQVWGRGMPLNLFEKLALAADLPVPDLTVFFDIPVETALARAAKRGRLDAFEKEGRAFMDKVRAGYVALSDREPERWMRVNCDGLDEGQTFEKFLAALQKRDAFCD